MKKLTVVLSAFSVLLFTACGTDSNVFMGTDLTPWLEEQEGYTVSCAANGYSAPVYDVETALGALMAVEVGEKIEYTDDTDQYYDLRNTNGIYSIGLNDAGSGKFKNFYFLDECNVLMVIEDFHSIYYRVAYNSVIQDYFISHTSYIPADKYAKLKECIDSAFTPENMQRILSAQETPVKLTDEAKLQQQFTIMVYGMGSKYTVSTSIVDYGAPDADTLYRHYPVLMTVLCDEAGNFTMGDIAVTG